MVHENTVYSIGIAVLMENGHMILKQWSGQHQHSQNNDLRFLQWTQQYLELFSEPDPLLSSPDSELSSFTFEPLSGIPNRGSLKSSSRWP